MTKRIKRYVADFETQYHKEDDSTEVVLWCITDIETMQPKIGYSIETFMYEVMGSEYKKSIMYFHNLKFDGSYIISWLLMNRWIFDRKIREPNSFNTLIGDMGQWYLIELSSNKLKIYDSLKLYPMSLKDIGKIFGLDKLDNDYDFSNGITEDDEVYIIRDCEILCKAIQNNVEHGLTKLTTGSNAMMEFRRTMSKDCFDKLFPELPQCIEDMIRPAYKGGYVYVNPAIKGKEINDKGMVFDVNSMYPWAMLKRLPIGETWFSEDIKQSDERLQVISLHCEYELKDKCIPTIFNSTTAGFSAYNKDCMMENLIITNIDYEHFTRNYNIYNMEIDYIVNFTEADNIFKSYIDKWMEVKRTKSGGERIIAKLMLNSLYGKFGSRRDGGIKIPWLDEDSGIVHYRLEESSRKPLYVPVAMFVSAWARDLLWRTIYNLNDRFLYCDTDSIHIIGTEMPNIDIDDSRLGAWKHEGTFDRAKYLGQKCYIEQFEEDLKVTVAGLPKSAHGLVTFENFMYGMEYPQKLQAKTVKGGTYLYETTYEIGER